MVNIIEILNIFLVIINSQTFAGMKTITLSQSQISKLDQMNDSSDSLRKSCES